MHRSVQVHANWKFFLNVINYQNQPPPLEACTYYKLWAHKKGVFNKLSLEYERKFMTEGTSRYIECTCSPVCVGAWYASGVGWPLRAYWLPHTWSILGSPTDWTTRTLYVSKHESMYGSRYSNTVFMILQWVLVPSSEPPPLWLSPACVPCPRPGPGSGHCDAPQGYCTYDEPKNTHTHTHT